MNLEPYSSDAQTVHVALRRSLIILFYSLLVLMMLC